MTATVTWNDDRILKLEFESPWAWNDYVNAAEAAFLMASIRPGIVDLIMDLRNAPGSSVARALEHFQQVWKIRPANMDRVVIVGSPVLTQRLQLLLLGSYADSAPQTHFAESVEEALTILLGIRVSRRPN